MTLRHGGRQKKLDGDKSNFFLYFYYQGKHKRFHFHFVVAGNLVCRFSFSLREAVKRDIFTLSLCDIRFSGRDA